ncbi:MAG TPA: nucleotidyltransferase family protein [Acidobacteriaceae bacterium]
MHEVPNTAAIILAAGASTRLGQPKQLATLNGETLLGRAVRIARETGCAPVLVVLGSERDPILAEIARGALGDVSPVINDRWQEGMATSIFFGVRALGFVAKQARGAILMTCDQPAITPEHLRALTASGDLTASEYAGRRGVPAYFPASYFAALTQLTGDSGARDLLHTARVIPLPLGELDIDTPETLAEAQRLFGHTSTN